MGPIRRPLPSWSLTATASSSERHVPPAQSSSSSALTPSISLLTRTRGSSMLSSPAFTASRIDGDETPDCESQLSRSSSRAAVFPTIDSATSWSRYKTCTPLSRNSSANLSCSSWAAARYGISSNKRRPMLSGVRLRNSLPGRWSMTFFNRPISDRICKLSPITLPGLSSWPYYPRFGRLIPPESRNDQRDKSGHKLATFLNEANNPI